jgi:hypothetical protein
VGTALGKTFAIISILLTLTSIVQPLSTRAVETASITAPQSTSGLTLTQQQRLNRAFPILVVPSKAKLENPQNISAREERVNFSTNSRE